MVPKTCLVLCIALVATCVPRAKAQVLAGNAGPADSGGVAMVLAGTVRSLRPDLAMHAVDEPPSASAYSMAPDFPITIGFDEGSDRLTPRATRTLDRLGLAIRSAAPFSAMMRLEGHADSIGAPDSNRELSKRRAEAVAQYLEQNFGMDAARFNCVGLGDRHPLVGAPGKAGAEPRNRVVRIVPAGDG